VTIKSGKTTQHCSEEDQWCQRTEAVQFCTSECHKCQWTCVCNLSPRWTFSSLVLSVWQFIR